MAKTIIVSNRLPVKISQEKNKLSYHTSEGGLATGLGSIYRDGDNIWVGWPGLAVTKTTQKAEITAHLATESMKPVFLSALSRRSITKTMCLTSGRITSRRTRTNPRT